MNERERASWLARTIDEILKGKRPATPPDGFDDQDVDGLLRAASTRIRLDPDATEPELQYEDTVWRRVLQRLDRRRRPRPDDQLSTASADQTAGERSPKTFSEDLRDIVSLRREMTSDMLSVSDSHRDIVWNKIQTRLTHRPEEEERGHVNRLFAQLGPRRAFATAWVAIVVATVALVPFTGLTHHPVAYAARYVGGYFGATESTSVPQPTADATLASATEVSAAEASELLGVSVSEPRLSGFELTSSRYFQEPITSDQGGTYVLSYQGTDPAQALMIYQELASNVDLAIGSGAATALTLFDDTPATYVEGAWEITGADGLSWDIGRTQTLIFQGDEVRTIVRYTGPEIEVSTLIAIADRVQ